MTRVLVTGAHGFLGRHLVPMIQDAEVITPSRADCDLTVQANVARLFATPPNVVIHLAADVGGIAYMRENPASTFANTSLMTQLVLEECRKHGVKKFLGVSTVNCYPGKAVAPFREEDLFSGLPDETVLGYGMAKRMMIMQSQLYRKQYGLNAVNLILDSIYGPGDLFAPGRSRVCPANIRRFAEAVEQGVKEVVVWGSGKPLRDFVYVEDAARAVMFALDHLESVEPVNIGSGSPVTIAQLVERIAAAVGYHGQVRWDTTKPDGQMNRHLDTTRMSELGFSALVPLDEGLAKTVSWYRKHQPV